MVRWSFSKILVVRCWFATSLVVPPFSNYDYYVIRVEFQVRGIPHIHSFLWMVNATSLTKTRKEEYNQYVDNIIHALLPDEMEEPKLYN